MVFVECFCSRYHHECLDREKLGTLTQDRVIIDDFSRDPTSVRLHSSLGNQSPKRFSVTCSFNPSRREAAGRPEQGIAKPTPSRHISQPSRLTRPQSCVPVNGMSQPLLQLPFAETAAWCALPSWPPPALQATVPLQFAQAWLQHPESALRPGWVWFFTTPDRFVVLAELHDNDIMTMGRRHNDPLWDLGDVFEIFLRHRLRAEYYEFHTAPNGVTLDMRYPRLYASRTAGVEQYMLAKPHFTSHVICEPEKGRWRVAAEIPVTNLVPPEFACTESEWQFSFCRYDCGPARPPVFSSTSPHTVADFHRAEDWPCFRVKAFQGI